MTVAALILTAGRSRRMGRAKAWLRLEGETLLERLVATSRAVGAAPVIVVVGAETDASLVDKRGVAAHISAPETLEIVVGAPDGQQIDSLRAGLQKAPAGAAVLLWPIDHPFATASLVSRMIAALAGPDRIVVPSSHGQRGHPILLGPDAASELLDPVADQGAHLVVRRSADRLVLVEHHDPRLAQRLNTPGDARRLGIE